MFLGPLYRERGERQARQTIVRMKKEEEVSKREKTAKRMLDIEEEEEEAPYEEG